VLKTVEQKCSSRGYVAALAVELPVGVKERRQLLVVMSCCLVYSDHVLVFLWNSMLWRLPPRTSLELGVRYDRMPARAAAELLSAAPRNQDIIRDAELVIFQRVGDCASILVT